MRRLATLVFFLPLLASATIFVSRPLQDEIRETSTIVRGKIGPSYADWGGNGSSNRIYTYYRLEVSEALKGDAGAGTILIREIGGERDGLGMQVAGAAHFSQGEDVVVFLDQKSADGSYQVHGLSSGKFNLVREADGTECLRGVALSGEDAPCEWTMDKLRQEIRDEGSAAAPTPEQASPTPAQAAHGKTVSAPQKQPAFQLQPSLGVLGRPSGTEAGESSSGGLAWIFALAIGVAGALALLLIPRK